MSGAASAPGGVPPAARARRPWAWIAVVSYLALIFYLSSLSDPLPAVTTRFWDKGLHFVEYGTLGALLLTALRGSGVGPGRAALLAIAGASLYGATDELHQWFVPNRSCDVLDWVADTLGGALGAGLAAAARWVLRSRQLDIQGERR